MGEYDPTRIIAALDYQDYAAAETRRSLFRVLARSIIRELKTAGHDGSDLIGFVSEVMKAVTDAGFEREERPPQPRGEPLEGLMRDAGSVANRDALTEFALGRKRTPYDRGAVRRS